MNAFFLNFFRIQSIDRICQFFLAEFKEFELSPLLRLTIDAMKMILLSLSCIVVVVFFVFFFFFF